MHYDTQPSISLLLFIILVRMTKTAELYKQYNAKAKSIEELQIDKIIAPYQELFDISIDDTKITFNKYNTPLNSILIERICGIGEEENLIYIVLPNSIYILNKNTGEIHINIK